jgi:hypothetical protein
MRSRQLRRHYSSKRASLLVFNETAQRGRFLLVVRYALSCLDVADGDLAGSAVFLGIEGDFLTFGQATHSGPLERGGMDKHVLAAIIRLNKAKAFLVVIELHDAPIHKSNLSLIEVQ